MSHNIEWIFFNEISTCKKNGNLMFTQVFTQRPFTCATNILSERKWDFICHIQMLLVLYHPCMANFVRIIYFMDDIGVRDQCGLLNVRFHNAFHNLISYEPMFLHFSCVHVVFSNCCHVFPCRNPSFGFATKAKGLQGCGPRRSPRFTSHILGV
jgi:hypothetical protein